MEDKLNKKHKDFIKANKHILKEILEIQKENIKNQVMAEESDNRREVLRELYWQYEHVWLPLTRETRKPKPDSFV